MTMTAPEARPEPVVPTASTAPAPATTGATPATATAPVRRSIISTDTLAVGAFFLALFAFVAAVFAVGLAARSVDEHRAVAAAISSGGGAAAAPVAVTLTEFKIEPAEIHAPVGGTLTVTNDGTVDHNVGVEGHSTPLIAAGETADLDLTGLAAGTYTIICEVPGHEGAGMKATLVIS